MRYRFSRKLGLFVRKVYSVYNEGLGVARLMGSGGDTKGHDPQRRIELLCTFTNKGLKVFEV